MRRKFYLAFFAVAVLGCARPASADYFNFQIAANSTETLIYRLNQPVQSDTFLGGFGATISVPFATTAAYYDLLDPAFEYYQFTGSITGGGQFYQTGCNSELSHCGRYDTVWPFFLLAAGTQDIEVTLNLYNLNPSASMFSGQVFFNIPDGFTIAAIPEPSTWAMMVIGFAGIALVMRRRYQLPKPEGTLPAY